MSFLSPYIWILKTLEEVDSGAPQAAGPRIKSAKNDWYILHEHELQVEPVDLTTFNQGLGIIQQAIRLSIAGHCHFSSWPQLQTHEKIKTNCKN